MIAAHTIVNIGRASCQLSSPLGGTAASLRQLLANADDEMMKLRCFSRAGS
jgi:hypothetical protein